MMQTIADLRGLKLLTRTVFKRAVDAICGMAEERDGETEGKPIVAITGLGGHKVVEHCRSIPIQKGYEPVIFHSVGTNACENL
jgi:uncharacterized protein (UPF0261 family)